MPRSREEKEREKKRQRKRQPMTVTTKQTDDRDNTLGPRQRGGARRAALRRQKPREGADKAGGSSTPAMGNTKREIRDELSGRDKTREMIDSVDRIGEVSRLATSVEMPKTGPVS
jgi:hypothetical protein